MNVAPYPQYNDLGGQRAISSINNYPGMFGNAQSRVHMMPQRDHDSRYDQSVKPRVQGQEGFHGEWGRGLYDSGLAGRHFVTTQRITRICPCGRPGCIEHDPRNNYSHDEMRTEYSLRDESYEVCATPMGFCGDGYNGRYAYMPSGYNYNSYKHPYDNGSLEKFGTYVTDYETGTNVAKGPIVAQNMRGPLRDKNTIMRANTFKTIKMPGSMNEIELMDNAFPGGCDSDPALRTMYKYPPQNVIETNISIFDNFIA
jgi:hypothetical protein